MEDAILTLAANMTGAAEEESEYLAALCAAEWEKLAAKYPEEETQTAAKNRLICAAACLAAADYFGAKGAAGAASWSAGDVSVRGQSGADCAAAAESLRAAAELLLAGAGEDGGFAFMGVKG